MKTNPINPKDYNYVINKLRDFFQTKGFIETPTQHRLSILAACEDPATIATYNYAGEVWPLPQTGQMHLEYELLTNPNEKGFYCISTSYRNEANPIPGRHDLIFPMFEFETHGGIDALLNLEYNLLEYLGFGTIKDFQRFIHDYSELAKYFDTEAITSEHEEALASDMGQDVAFLTMFPQYTSPFWNMKKVGDKANKVDVILYGMETIGSAERSTDPQEMDELFHTISDGMYSKMLYAQFGKERVERELHSFLSLNFFPRCGGGIGITRLIRAMKLAGILSDTITTSSCRCQRPYCSNEIKYKERKDLIEELEWNK